MTKDECKALSILAQRANTAESNREGMWLDFVRSACDSIGAAAVANCVKEWMQAHTRKQEGHDDNKELGDSHSRVVSGGRG